MKKVIVLILALIFADSTKAQLLSDIKLHTKIRIDTLYAWLDNFAIQDSDLRISQQKQFDSVISVFNHSGKKFIIKKDSTFRSLNYIKITISKIRYSSLKESIIYTGVDAALLSA